MTSTHLHNINTLHGVKRQRKELSFKMGLKILLTGPGRCSAAGPAEGPGSPLGGSEAAAAGGPLGSSSPGSYGPGRSGPSSGSRAPTAAGRRTTRLAGAERC